MTKKPTYGELERRIKELEKVIVDHRQEKEAFQESEEHFRSLMKSAKGFVLYRLAVDSKDAYNSNIIFVSPSLKDIIGVSPQQDFCEWFKNIHPDDLISVDKARKESIETGSPFDQLTRIYHSAKGKRWIRTISNPVLKPDGNPAYYNGLMIDVTAQKQAEKQLQATTNILNSILDSATEYAIAATDLEFRILHYNPTAEQLFGYKAKEVLGRTVQEIHAREKVDKNHFDKTIKAVSQYGKYEYDVVSHDSNGQERFVHATVMPMHDDTGADIGYILFARNVTEFIKLRSKLIRSERLAATGQLGVSIAHEINSPLQAITFILNSLRKNYVQDKELTENISLLKEAFGSISNTVRNLLDLNRPGQDKKQKIKINNVIEKTVALIQTQLKKNKVKINLDLSSKIPDINASPQQLSHVFLNLFNNAIEAMTGISKSINVGMSHKTGRNINVITYLNEGSIVIKVADNGPGISEDDLEHIFDPFYTRKKQMGLGVGLSVCNDMIEGHGGTIVAENAPDGSAVFTIKLPRLTQGRKERIETTN